MHIPKQLAGCFALMCLAGTTYAQSPLPKETLSVTQLSAADDHRSYLVDFEFNNMIATRIVVVDPDQQKYLGMVPTGGAAPAVLSHDRSTLYTADSFNTRYVRGERTDVLTAWDNQTLTPKWEIKIPTKRAFTLTERYALAISSDDRFVYVYNFTPATSVTVVDIQNKTIASEIAINGCILNYPAGPRRFASLCGDGSLQLTTLNDQGREVARSKTPLFDPDKERLVERATAVGNRYYFVTTTGMVVPVDLTGEQAQVLPRWSLVDAAEQSQGWAPGGWQLLAASPGLNRLYVLMHPNHKPHNWEDPSTTIWAYDLGNGRKVGTLQSPNLIWSLSATADQHPLLLGVNIEGGLEIFDLTSGQHTATMPGITKTPTLVLNH